MTLLSSSDTWLFCFSIITLNYSFSFSFPFYISVPFYFKSFNSAIKLSFSFLTSSAACCSKDNYWVSFLFSYRWFCYSSMIVWLSSLISLVRLSDYCFSLFSFYCISVTAFRCICYDYWKLFIKFYKRLFSVSNSFILIYKFPANLSFSLIFNLKIFSSYNFSCKICYAFTNPWLNSWFNFNRDYFSIRLLDNVSWIDRSVANNSYLNFMICSSWLVNLLVKRILSAANCFKSKFFFYSYDWLASW